MWCLSGADWSYPPFEGTEADGALYGRGSVDDKGPWWAALFAMKAVRRQQIACENHVRHIIGADEESGMRCLNISPAEEAPGEAFHRRESLSFMRRKVSDLMSSRMGGRGYPAAGIKLLAVSGGSKVNMVPAQAVATLSCAAADWPDSGTVGEVCGPK